MMKTNLKVTDPVERHCVARAMLRWREATHLHEGAFRHIVYVFFFQGLPYTAMADRKIGRVIQVTLGSKIIEL